MGLYERLLEEASREKRASGHTEAAHSYGRIWSPPAPGAGGYVTVEDLEWEEERRTRERMEALRRHKRRTSDIRALRALAHQGVSSPWQGMAFKSLQRKYPRHYDQLKWGQRSRR